MLWNLEDEFVVVELYYEKRWYLRYSSSIRDDLVVIFFVLMCVYMMSGDLFWKNMVQIFYDILGCCLFCNFNPDEIFG